MLKMVESGQRSRCYDAATDAMTQDFYQAR
jgi:hypothetical protein